MISEPIVGFQKKIDVQRKGVVGAGSKFLSPLLPSASGGHVGCNTNKGLMVITNSLTEHLWQHPTSLVSGEGRGVAYMTGGWRNYWLCLC